MSGSIPGQGLPCYMLTQTSPCSLEAIHSTRLATGNRYVRAGFPGTLLVTRLISTCPLAQISYARSPTTTSSYRCHRITLHRVPTASRTGRSRSTE